jgi:hypothetical protein
MNNTKKEMLDSVEKSLEALTPAIRLRHEAAGMGLYSILMSVENGLLLLKKNLLSKEVI